MSKERNSELSTTLVSLMNTIGRALDSHLQELDVYDARREEYSRKIEKYRDTDRAELYRLNFSVYMCESHRIMAMLLVELWQELEKNPFPGKFMRAYAAACELFPEAEIPKQGTYAKVWKGEAAWKRVFKESRIPLNMMVAFPVQAHEWDIDALERQLHALAQEDGYIYASSVPALLGLNPNGKEYRNVKKELSCRGWEWKSRRNNGNLLKIIIPPNSLKEFS